MKARLIPLYFTSPDDLEFRAQLEALYKLLGEEAEFLQPLPLGSRLPEAEAVIFPQMLGAAFRRLAEFRSIRIPILVVTSEFGTVSMWDWEINQQLRAEGLTVIAPYDLKQTRQVCRMLAAKRRLRGGRFLVYQDNPGEGFQAEIFKRFYWWEDDCTVQLEQQFGIQVERRSFKALGAAAKEIPDASAREAWRSRSGLAPLQQVSEKALLRAMKIYLMLARELDETPNVVAAGINCLNESQFSDTTPCLAWNLLFEERGLIWGCEADTISMLTKYLMVHGLGAKAMMTNLYPFLMGQAALKHEHISEFPVVTSHPENHILAAHCGYLGVVPKSFSTQWALKPKVLAIVDDHATAIDARMPEGPMSLVKLVPPFNRLSVTEGDLIGYAGFANSHCLNGAVLRVGDGRKLMEHLPSHHTILTCGTLGERIGLLARVFGLQVEQI